MSVIISVIVISGSASEKFAVVQLITCPHGDVIDRLLEDVAEHAEEMNEYILENLELTPFECDGMWIAVKKTEKG